MKGGVNEKRTYLNADGNKGRITTQVWRDAERIAKHPEVLDRVIEKAKASDTIEIPTNSFISINFT